MKQPNLKLGGDYNREPKKINLDTVDITLKTLLIALLVSLFLFSVGVMFVLKVLVDKGIVN